MISENKIKRFEQRKSAPYYTCLAEQGDERSVFLIDLEKVAEQYKKIKRYLPQVKIFYAVKCLPCEQVVKCLGELGSSFDVCSTGEIDLVNCLQTDNINENKLYTHPVYTDKDIEIAINKRCFRFVIDNIEDLKKFIKYKDKVSLLIRVSFLNDKAVFNLSKKFGCELSDVGIIYQEAQRLSINISGISFHVGSQCIDYSPFVEAIKATRKVITQYNLKVLNIGGGFPVDYDHDATFDESLFFKKISQELELVDREIEIIAEPGRYLVASCAISISKVIAKKERKGVVWYYLNDGLYGVYNGLYYDEGNYPLMYFTDNYQENNISVLAGPTCDSIDLVAENISLPSLKVGSVIVAKMIGAYCFSTISDFNSLLGPKIVFGRHPDMS